jgi:hypothetical protein
MNRFLRFSDDFQSQEYPDHISATIRVDDSIIADWCFELCLLKEELTQSLTIVGADGRLSLRLQRQMPKLGHRGTVRWKENVAELALADTELDMWLHFFLKYHRDKIGEVDHIDAEFTPLSPADARELYLTLEVPLAAPPISEQELERMLAADETASKKRRKG